MFPREPLQRLSHRLPGLCSHLILLLLGTVHLKLRWSLVRIRWSQIWWYQCSRHFQVWWSHGLVVSVIPSPVVPEVLPLSSVLPVMATSILCLESVESTVSSVYLVAPMKAISEPFVCPVMTKKAVSETSACPIMATEAISELCLPFGDKRRP